MGPWHGGHIFRTELPISQMWNLKGPPGGISLRRLEAEAPARHPHSIRLQLEKLIACPLCHLSSACELQPQSGRGEGEGEGERQAAWSRGQPRWSLALTPAVRDRSVRLRHQNSPFFGPCDQHCRLHGTAKPTRISGPRIHRWKPCASFVVGLLVASQLAFGIATRSRAKQSTSSIAVAPRPVPVLRLRCRTLARSTHSLTAPTREYKVSPGGDGSGSPVTEDLEGGQTGIRTPILQAPAIYCHCPDPGEKGGAVRAGLHPV